MIAPNIEANWLLHFVMLILLFDLAFLSPISVTPDGWGLNISRLVSWLAGRGYVSVFPRINLSDV